MTAARPRALRPGQWDLASAPRRVVPLYLSIEALAAGLVAFFPGGVPTEQDLARFGALLVVGCLQTELSLSTEKARRYLADGPHISMTSVWMFGGAVVLPAFLAVALTVIIYLHLWLRVWWSVQRRSAYRVAFSATTVVLACVSVHPVLTLLGADSVQVDSWQGARVLLAVVVAALAYTTINGGLVAVGIKLHHPTRPWRRTLGTRSENALELATLSLGGAAAVLVVTQPALVALMLLPVMVLHRNILMRQLEEKASQDSKTGLLTAEEWRVRVAAELMHTHEPFAVLMVDLDRFKRVNDTYGHMAGDAVLRTVAETVTKQLRSYDSVGRWGGEEFAVLLPQVPDEGAREVAERIRRAVAELEVPVSIDDTSHTIRHLSASVGVAPYPEAGTTVDGLIHAADTAMYRAKHAGRDTVVSWADHPVQERKSIAPTSPPNLRLRPPS
ncbi:GGDEF domain-containing protein [Actinophytocola oryzae]|uniref:Diguanylate cyclase (GGDEF)-like protein n=1 Tax=Actinophytocola oryzae TaxID=502181 RepID=A0A4R7VPI6_9PSEU|nr:diguanylate cyclase [Actinophytocola oryzae]TDV51127.1 diguanylate cyclase (GGDEF)-like protein [Actinophytocola oryzae]